MNINMNKNMTIAMNMVETRSISTTVKNLFGGIRRAAISAVELVIGENGVVGQLGRYYADVLERPVNRRQTWHLLHAQLAFLMVAFPVECPLLLRMLFAAWFVTAVKMCKQAMNK